MRDPERIPRILEKVGERWRENPDQRLGQLIMNIARFEVQEQVWVMEDDRLEATLNDPERRAF